MSKFTNQDAYEEFHKPGLEHTGEFVRVEDVNIKLSKCRDKLGDLPEYDDLEWAKNLSNPIQVQLKLINETISEVYNILDDATISIPRHTLESERKLAVMEVVKKVREVIHDPLSYPDRLENVLFELERIQSEIERGGEK